MKVIFWLLSHRSFLKFSDIKVLRYLFFNISYQFWIFFCSKMTTWQREVKSSRNMSKTELSVRRTGMLESESCYQKKREILGSWSGQRQENVWRDEIDNNFFHQGNNPNSHSATNTKLCRRQQGQQGHGSLPLPRSLLPCHSLLCWCLGLILRKNSGIATAWLMRREYHMNKKGRMGRKGKSCILHWEQ